MMNLFENETTEEIRSLSWKQPFASLMLDGKIETRTWPTNYRGLVLICASQSPYSSDGVRNICGPQYTRDLELKRLSSPRGKAIAVGRLVYCRRMTPADAEKCFVQYFDDLWCHIYEDVRAIEPFDWKGSQGWRKLTKEEIAKIKYV